MDSHRGNVEVLIRRDELLYQPRRGERTERGQPFVLPKSLIGIFIRKVYILIKKRRFCFIHGGIFGVFKSHSFS